MVRTYEGQDGFFGSRGTQVLFIVSEKHQQSPNRGLQVASVDSYWRYTPAIFLPSKTIQLVEVAQAPTGCSG